MATGHIQTTLYPDEEALLIVVIALGALAASVLGILLGSISKNLQKISNLSAQFLQIWLLE